MYVPVPEKTWGIEPPAKLILPAPACVPALLKFPLIVKIFPPSLKVLAPVIVKLPLTVLFPVNCISPVARVTFRFL